MIHRILFKIERTCAEWQGKGWGGATTRQEVNSLKKILTMPTLVIDIGANIGDYTAALQKKFGDVEIHLFEPAKVNYDKLLNRFGGSNVIVNQNALADKNIVAKLYSPGTTMASLTQRPMPGFDSYEEVAVITFESYWKQKLNSRDIDLIKMDVEGHEMDVLHGMGDAILKTKVIQFEFGGCNIDTKTYFRDFFIFFEKFNFRVFRITPLGLQRIYLYSAFHEFFHTTNFICVRIET